MHVPGAKHSEPFQDFYRPMPDNPQYWSRCIAFVDMDAFFASIEQRDHPEYRGRPIGITNGLTGTCLITCTECSL